MIKTGDRVDVLWHYYCHKRKKHVEEWLPGECVGFSSGLGGENFNRINVKMDDPGFRAIEKGCGAHPDCVRRRA